MPPFFFPRKCWAFFVAKHSHHSDCYMICHTIFFVCATLFFFVFAISKFSTLWFLHNFWCFLCKMTVEPTFQKFHPRNSQKSENSARSSIYYIRCLWSLLLRNTVYLHFHSLHFSCEKILNALFTTEFAIQNERRADFREIQCTGDSFVREILKSQLFSYFI